MAKKIKIRAKAVIFDMDGVITNTMPDHFRVWKKIFAREGIHASYYDIYKREGQPGINSVREIFLEHKKSFTTAEAKKILQDKERLFKKVVKERFIVGARRFLRFMRREGFSMALVTGTSHHELRRILSPFHYGLFSVIVTGSDVRHGKPHPEPYLLALKKLKINPKLAVVIENAPFGIQSAKRAGLRCIALETSLSRKYLMGADYIFKSIKDMRARVAFCKCNVQEK